MLVDLHCDTVLKLWLHENTHLKSNRFHVDIDKMKKAESLVQFFAMYVDLDKMKKPLQTCLNMIDKFYQEVEINSDEIAIAYTYDDIEKNRLAGKLTGFITIEEGGVIEGNIKNLRNLYRLGVRAMTLTWNYENQIGYPNTDEFRNKGLKPFGIEVVAEMNRLGMIIDVSHLSDGGFYDVLKYSQRPFVATHSNARHLRNHPRNLTDDMLRKLAEAGGVTGMNFCSWFLEDDSVSRVDTIADHIVHIYRTAGIDVLAIGSDYDGIGGELELKDISYIHLLEKCLRGRGFSSQAIDKIFYRNALRVMKDNF